MAGAIAPLSDFSTWARGNLLVIVLLILGAVLLTRLADWARGQIMRRIDARAADTEELVRSEAAKHRHVVAQVFTWSILAVIIAQVTNLSRDWARAVIDVPVPSSVDVGHATEVLQRVGEEVYGEDRLRKKMLDQPSVMGVERMEVDVFSLRIVARTLPGMQFDVGRVIRARVARTFRSEGIIVSAELDTGHATGNAS